MNNSTYSLRLLLLCVLLSAGIVPAFAQQVEKHLTLSNKEKIGFLEYKPANYATEGNVKHPVIIFLHGIGERGNGTTDLKYVARIGLPRMIKLGHNMSFTWNGKKETFLVVSPQCLRNYGMWPELLVNEMIQYVKQNLHVDTNRIYITGLSMGGGGTYKYISRQQSQAEKVAAAATICAPCTFKDGNNVAKAKLPIWSFHAANDSIALALCTESAVRKIDAANPAVKPLKTIWPDGGHNVWDRVYTDTTYRYHGVINIYEWFLGQSKAYGINRLPVANAGRDIKISIRDAQVSLNASASSDADGKLVRYVWKKISGPIAGKINAPMSANPVTTVTGLTKAGVYKYEVAVVDNRAAFTRDTITVTVDAQAAPANKIPIAKAGRDTTIMLPAGVTIKGAGVDTDGTIASYSWSMVSGGKVKLSNINQASLRADSLAIGVYVFRLTVTDNKSTKATDDVRLTVLADTTKTPVAQPDTATKPVTQPKPDTATSKPDTTTTKPVVTNPGTSPQKPAPAANKPPVARVTPDQVIPIEWNYFPSVSGYPTTDPDGWIALFTWEKISGPDTFNIMSPRTCRTRINNLVPGVYVFRVTAYDNKGASSYADVKITMTKKEATKKAATVANGATVEQEPVAAAVPLTHVTMPAQVTLYPNPAYGVVNLQYNANVTGRSVINIYDAAGKLIKAIPFHKGEGTYRHQLEISQLVNGMYYVEVKTGNKTGMQTKLVKR